MAKRPLRSGNSTSPLLIETVEDQDIAPVRLTNLLHVQKCETPSVFRVLAVLPDDETSLICLAETRERVVMLTKERAKESPFPKGTICLRLERWIGPVTSGHWEAQRTRRGELPVIRRSFHPLRSRKKQRGK